MSDSPRSPTSVPASVRPVPAVIGIVLRERDVLLVRRANPPDAGRWGFPGGKIEAGNRLRTRSCARSRKKPPSTSKRSTPLPRWMRSITMPAATCVSIS